MEANIFSVAELQHFSPNLGFPISNPNSSLSLSFSFKIQSDCHSKRICALPYPIPYLKLNSMFASSTIDRDKESVGSVNPVYVPTPPNRELRTPHSGYHFDGTARKFFEGWYFKVSILERRPTFCFMNSVLHFARN